MSNHTRPLPLSTPLEKPAPETPRYESGWMANFEDGQPDGYVAFLRPYSEDWYDLYRRPNWWEALATAVEISQTTPDCEYVGGPGQ